MKVTIVISGGPAADEPRQLPPIRTSLLPRPAAAQVRHSIVSLKKLSAAHKEEPTATVTRHYDIRVEHDNGQKDHLVFSNRDNLTPPALVVLLTLAGMG